MKTTYEIRKKMNAQIETLFNEYGGFYAFSKEQYEAKAVEGVTYAHCGTGLIAPKENAKTLVEGIAETIKNANAEILRTLSKKDLIWEELANHEASYTGEWDDAADYLWDAYKITEEEVRAEFTEYMMYCAERMTD